jgi:hypothetical protein
MAYAAIQEVPHIKIKETCFGLMSGGRKYFEASSSIINIYRLIYALF